MYKDTHKLVLALDKVRKENRMLNAKLKRIAEVIK
jgi:TATA-binding protein-associated factor Taf7